MKKQRITAREFVGAYITNSGDAQAVADHLGISRTDVYGKVNYYRKHGVKLPKYRKAIRLDVAGLNSYIKELKG